MHETLVEVFRDNEQNLLELSTAWHDSGFLNYELLAGILQQLIKAVTAAANSFPQWLQLSECLRLKCQLLMVGIVVRKFTQALDLNKQIEDSLVDGLKILMTFTSENLGQHSHYAVNAPVQFLLFEIGGAQSVLADLVTSVSGWPCDVEALENKMQQYWGVPDNPVSRQCCQATALKACKENNNKVKGADENLRRLLLLQIILNMMVFLSAQCY